MLNAHLQTLIPIIVSMIPHLGLREVPSIMALVFQEQHLILPQQGLARIHCMPPVALLQIIQEQRGVSAEAAAVYLSELQDAGRYQRDVY